MPITFQDRFALDSLFFYEFFTAKYNNRSTVSYLGAVRHSEPAANKRICFCSPVRCLLIAHEPLTGLCERITFCVFIVDQADMSQCVHIALLIQVRILLERLVSQFSEKLREWQLCSLALFLIVSSASQKVSAEH